MKCLDMKSAHEDSYTASDEGKFEIGTLEVLVNFVQNAFYNVRNSHLFWDVRYIYSLLLSNRI